MGTYLRGVFNIFHLRNYFRLTFFQGNFCKVAFPDTISNDHPEHQKYNKTSRTKFLDKH